MHCSWCLWKWTSFVQCNSCFMMIVTFQELPKNWLSFLGRISSPLLLDLWKGKLVMLLLMMKKWHLAGYKRFWKIVLQISLVSFKYLEGRLTTFQVKLPTGAEHGYIENIPAFSILLGLVTSNGFGNLWSINKWSVHDTAWVFLSQNVV